MKKREVKTIAIIGAFGVFAVLAVMYVVFIFREQNTSFEIYFVDVGQADAALVLCDGKSMLIDGGNVADSSLIYTFLKEKGINQLDIVVCTHPHEDHVGGLAGALNYAEVKRAFCSETEYETKAFNNFKKYVEKQRRSIEIPKAGESITLGQAAITFLGPINKSPSTNNNSIVLRIQYKNTSFLFMGDAEREEELDLLENGCKLESTVLKIGHHGSESSTTYPFLREVMPKYAVISVGANNGYGHPSDSVLSKLNDAEVTILRTDINGTITCKSDGETVTFSTEK